MGRRTLIAFGALLLALPAGCANRAPLPSLSPSPIALPSIVHRPLSTAKIDDEPGMPEDGLPEKISLQIAIDFALRNNPRLRSALAGIDQAEGQQQAAFAPFLPRFDMLNRYIATTENLGPGAPGPTGGLIPLLTGANQAWQTELQLQWMVYDFGRTAGRYGQAEMRTAIARTRSARMRETVAVEVAVAYFQAMEAAANRTIAEETIRRAQAILEDVKARKAAGVALRDDVLRNEVELASARDLLVRAREAELAGQARLNNSMGRDASLPVVLADEPRQPPVPAPLPETIKQAMDRRPEIAAARDRIALAQFGRVAARGEFLPEVSVRGSIGRVDGQNIEEGWQQGVGIHINIPLYHGGQSRGNLRAAEGDIRQSVADAQTVVNDVSLQVTLAHREATFANERIGYARPAVAQAEENLRVVRERFRNGTAMPTDVVDAQTALTRAQQRYASSRIEYLAALARLAYAIGEEAGTVGEREETPPAEELPPPKVLPAAAEQPTGIQWRRADR